LDKFSNEESSITCCIEDEGVPERGRSFVGGLQGQPTNRLAVLWPKSMVLNGQGKGSLDGSGMDNGDERK
jgi:hypothetical protein